MTGTHIKHGMRDVLNSMWVHKLQYKPCAHLHNITVATRLKNSIKIRDNCCFSQHYTHAYSDTLSKNNALLRLRKQSVTLEPTHVGTFL